MNISELFKTILAVIGAVGGIVVIVGGLSAWLGKIWADKLYLKESAKHQKEIEKLKNDYTTELEHLRAEITERRDLLNTTITAMSNGYASSHERIVTALELLWNTVLEIRGFVSPLIFFYQILLPQEYNNIPADKLNSVIPTRPKNDLDNHMLKIDQAIEDKRPFIGESLWSLFWVYRAFAHRAAYKVIDQRANGKLYEWDRDNDDKTDYMRNMLRFVFTEDELDAIINPKIGQASQLGIPQRILDALERKILDEMNEWIFGKRLINMSIEERQRIASLLPPIRSK